MTLHDESNHLFQLAVRFVNQTGRHIFLTGKAGTGKTTFLKYIKENSFKKTAVVAPTGVAAINAGGVTMHSFFQLPFGPFIPARQAGWNNGSSVTDQHSLFKNIRFNNEKRELLRELELLIIDEVSMVRADMLDAVDTILRHFRRQPLQPFGGVQVLYIGDLFQLPPVVKNDEWQLLSPYYNSPFFFDAQVIQQSQPLLIELKKIYRQSETGFINILNNIRNNNASYEDLQQLHTHYKPGYEPAAEENFITLTTHNAKADAINQNKLNKLAGKAFEFKGEITGEFFEKALPADLVLQLKEGAQIMFIKNDKGEARKYYNGKIGKIKKVSPDKILVSFPGEEDALELEKETWKNIRYTYDKEKDFIDEEELGSFKQYPIRLAWAITIHKSQGLTFDKAIIDAGESFAPGQVYVALSRLTSLDGLILYSRIQPHCISTDERVLRFAEKEMNGDELNEFLQREQRVFISNSLLQSFDPAKISETLKEFYEEYEHRMIPEKNEAVSWAHQFILKNTALNDVAAKFIKQLQQLLLTAEEDGYKQLHERIAAANEYFLKAIDEQVDSLKKHINEYKVKQRIKKYMKSLHELQLLFVRKQQQLIQSGNIAEALMKGENTTDLLTKAEQQKKIIIQFTEEIAVAAKPKKGETKNISLQLFKEGNKIPDIAKIRSLTVTTIEGHLSEFILTGEVAIEEIVPLQKIEIISKAIDEATEPGSSAVKQKLGDNFSYGEIKAVYNYKEWLKKPAHT
jgi:GTPase SAR1 family protein